MNRRVFFYVQHLLGVGHVFRAVRLAQGLRQAGFAVDLVMGGVPVPKLDFAGLNVTQLLPLKAGPDGFSDLVTASGEPAGPEIKAHRAAQLLDAFARSRPDVVLMEAFPFGRRPMHFELMPLLDAAYRRIPRPRIVCSVRDILQEQRAPKRTQETARILNSYFDCVIVHGDPRLVTLDVTFPLAAELSPKVSYSGIVGPRRLQSESPSDRIADVVVSAGGGALGLNLVETAIAAKSSTSLASARWLVLTGPNLPASDFDRIRSAAEANGVAVERFLTDLAAVLAGARLSISQAGYSTAADILSARCKAVLVPFSDAGETEQARRASLLQSHGFGVALAEPTLTVATLAAAIERALALPSPTFEVDLDGAERTAALLSDLLSDDFSPAALE